MSSLHTAPSSIAAAKAQAKALRRGLAQLGREISHGQALELVAEQSGARNWNVLHASLTQASSERPETIRFGLGTHLSARYMGVACAGRIVALAQVGPYQRVTLRLDRPVSPVHLDAISVERRQIRAVIGPDGVSKQRRSDGTPHLVLELSG